MFQLRAIVDRGVPGRVATGTSLEFGPGKEGEGEVNLAFPEELILLLCRETLAGGVRRGRVKTTGGILQGRRQGGARSTPGGLLGRRQGGFGLVESNPWVRDIVD